jgi:hypothetical protein
MTEQQQVTQRNTIIQILAMSALPGWACVVALVLWVVVPTIDTVRSLNTSMTKVIERMDGEVRLNELKFKKMEEEHAQLEQRVAQNALSTDRRLEKIEDGSRGWFGGSKR